MNKSRVMQSLLLDFYGELLTEKQRECYDLHYNEDLSLSEIAQQAGISRQGVWDNIKRAEDSLEDIEEKTGLVRRFQETKEALIRLSEIVDKLQNESEGKAKQLALEAGKEIETLLSRG